VVVTVTEVQVWVLVVVMPNVDVVLANTVVDVPCQYVV